MKYSYLLFVLILGLSVNSCNKYDCKDLEANIGDTCDDGDDMTEDDVITADCNCEGTEIPVTYTNTIQAITDASCGVVGCHAGTEPAGGFPLTSYDEVSFAAGFGRMIGAINYDDGFANMPPNGQLSQDDIDAITEWIENGTPE